MVEHPIITRKKDPAAKLDYGVDWSSLLAEGVTIETSTWATEAGTDGAAALTLSDSDHDDATTVVWVEGGDDGVEYDLTNEVVLSNGAVDQRTIRINVVNR
jgi:hypothetical protein